MLFNPSTLWSIFIGRVQHPKGHLVCAKIMSHMEDTINILPVITIRHIDTQPQIKVIFFNLRTQQRNVHTEFSWCAVIPHIKVSIEGRERQSNCVDANMVTQKSQVIAVDQNTGCLHFNLPKRLPHELHKQTEICKKISVLLWFTVPSQHDGIDSLFLTIRKTFEIVFEIKVIKRFVIVHLIFRLITVHPANAESTIIDAFLVWDYNT